MAETIRFEVEEEALDFLDDRGNDPAEFAKAAFDARLFLLKGETMDHATAEHYRSVIREARERESRGSKSRVEALLPDEDEGDEQEGPSAS